MLQCLQLHTVLSCGRDITAQPISRRWPLLGIWQKPRRDFLTLLRSLLIGPRERNARMAQKPYQLQVEGERFASTGSVCSAARSNARIPVSNRVPGKSTALAPA